MHIQALVTTLLSLFSLTCALPHALPTSGDNPVNVVSNSVSPGSANDAGNGNTNTGLLNGNSFKERSDPSDTVSNSLSPGSANAAGNNNENTGTLDGNTVNVDPTVDPTVNVARDCSIS